MKKTAIVLAASAFAGTSAFTHAPLVLAQQSRAMSQAEANQVANSLGQANVDEAVEAGYIVQVDGGYALTSRGLQAAEGAGLLVSKSLIPLAVGFGDKA